MHSSPAHRAIALLLALAVFALVLAAIATSSPGQTPLQKRQLAWVQPPELASQYPTRISPWQWQFDFQPAEQHLKALYSGNETVLELTPHTGNLLQKAARALPADLPDTDIERMAFLIQQSHPGPAGEQLAEVFSGYLRYLQAMRSIEDGQVTGNAAGALSAREEFNRMVDLQNQHLGEGPASRLFADQRRLRDYLLQRREIQMNPELNALQRKQALEALSRRFEAPGKQP